MRKDIKLSSRIRNSIQISFFFSMIRKNHTMDVKMFQLVYRPKKLLTSLGRFLIAFVFVSCAVRKSNGLWRTYRNDTRAISIENGGI